VLPSDLPGVNPATLNGILLYYRLMTKWSGLGDSTKLSRVGLSHPSSAIYLPRSRNLVRRLPFKRDTVVDMHMLAYL
jgi:hypothetical protein